MGKTALEWATPQASSFKARAAPLPPATSANAFVTHESILRPDR